MLIYVLNSTLSLSSKACAKGCKVLLLTFSWSWGSRSCWGGGGRCRRLTTSAVLTVEIPATVGVSHAVFSLRRAKGLKKRSGVQMVFSESIRVLPLPRRLEVPGLPILRRRRRPRHRLLQVHLASDMARRLRADRHHRALHRVRHSLPRLQEEN